MDKPEISNFTTLDFDEWTETGSLVLVPKFQRREVWKTPAKSYFIDSILNGIPIPPMSLRLAQSDDRKRIIREVIDGQQRLKALLHFLHDEYALSKGVTNLAGKRFSALPKETQDALRSASFLCQVFTNISDADVLKIFARVNTYSVGLNAQELRNGRFFGRFKQMAYNIALAHLEFWRRYRVFSESAIARMNEVELTSELMVAMLAGQQDKKKSIDSFYTDYDEVFPNERRIRQRFATVIDLVAEHLDTVMADIEFRRAPLFYSLFCVVYHRCYQLPGETLKTPQNGILSRTEGAALRNACITLSDKITSAKQDKPVSRRDIRFVTACLRQTDNLRPRQIRFTTLYNEAFG